MCVLVIEENMLHNAFLIIFFFHIHTGFQVFVFRNFHFLFVDYINFGPLNDIMEDSI